MPSLKDLKTRINSVKSTQKITKAMKMVAASKLRRAREAAEASRPYAEAMERMLQRLAQGYAGQGNAPTLLAGTGKDALQLVVVVTSDRGLAGALNTSIVRAVRKHVRELQAQGKHVRLYCIGRKGREQLAGEFRDIIIGQRSEVAKKAVEYAAIEEIAQEILAIIAREGIDVVGLFYSHFKSAISQVATYQQLMPLVMEETTAPAAPTEYEPNEEEILSSLLPRNIAMQLFKAVLESTASEHGARMNAMESATKNAGEMIRKLSLKYNRTRQANITKELIEIISGAEAL